MIHGEKYFKTFTVDNGQKTCKKPMRWCVSHGGIDAFLFHSHLTCDSQPKPRHGAFNEFPKVMRKAA